MTSSSIIFPCSFVWFSPRNGFLAFRSPLIIVFLPRSVNNLLSSLLSGWLTGGIYRFTIVRRPAPDFISTARDSSAPDVTLTV